MCFFFKNKLQILNSNQNQRTTYKEVNWKPSFVHKKMDMIAIKSQGLWISHNHHFIIIFPFFALHRHISWKCYVNWASTPNIGHDQRPTNVYICSIQTQLQTYFLKWLWKDTSCPRSCRQLPTEIFSASIVCPRMYRCRPGINQLNST